MSEQQRPRFYGVHTYDDPLGRFRFRYPSGWRQFALDNERDGVMYAPPDDVDPASDSPATYFAVWINKLDTKVTAEDLDDVVGGLDAGLNELAGCDVTTTASEALDNLLKLERVYTFAEDGGAVRQRRLWVLYADTWQYVVSFQGASPDRYDYWLPMGNYAFATFTLPEALWFATDRTLAHPHAV